VGVLADGGGADGGVKETMMVEAGKVYRMKHRRKGEAVVRCIEPYDDGGKFLVVKGTLRGMRDYYEPGDEFVTVNNLATFEELPQ
jgi:hypothetical protein